MGSKEIRRLLRQGSAPQRDTRRIHELARALARERLHLRGRAARPSVDRDLLWSREVSGFKIATRTVGSLDDNTTLEVSISSDADFLLGVFLEKESFRLLGMIRIPWTMVEWLGRTHGNRWRLTWSTASALRGVAEIL